MHGAKGDSVNRPAYPKYKPSGVDWLGEVPEHWEVKRLKMAAALVDKKTEAEEESPLPYIGLENVESWTGKLLPISEDVVPSGMANLFAAGNTLFGKLRPYLAKACNPTFDGLCSTELLVLQGREIDRRFLLFFLLSDGFIKQVDASTYGSKMPRANWDFIGNSRVPLPPLPEQRVIADFLDRETGRIDTLVGKKRELIVRLKERRAALITRAVTRGLDPAAKLKDSGVEWLGMVPQGWEVKRVKHVVATLVQGWSPQCESYPVDGPEEWGVLKVGCVNGGAFNPGENKRLPPELEPMPELGIREGDLLISRANTRDLVGSAAVACENYPNLMLCDKLYRLRLRSRLCTPRFLADYLGIRMVRGQIELDATGASDSMQNIGQSTILELTIALPPLAEQRAIADHLDRETGKLDRLTASVEAAIERLQEYRAALITAAVTGKIDVREAPAKEAA